LCLSAAGLDLPLFAEVDVTLLTWSHECIVGVEAIDDQHGILMDTLNELRVMLLRGAERRDVNLQLERLIDFTQMHFQSEEQLLLQQGFPGINDHRTAHKHLLAKLYAALEQINHEEALHFPSLLGFLPSWYLDHVEKLDQPCGVWLNQHGVY
jgi:hemerythrin-like metal-binding protein